MLKIRLQRVGRKHDPSYRVILTDKRQGPKSGKFIEVLGFYDAVRKVKKIKAERVKHWIANGAQVSDTVHNILVSEKVIESKKVNVLPKKTPIKKEVKEEEKKEVVLEGDGKKEEEKEEVKTEEIGKDSVEEEEKSEEVVKEESKIEEKIEEIEEKVKEEEKKE